MASSRPFFGVAILRWTQGGNAMASTHRNLEGVHVLIVEDTDDSCEMLETALEYCGALVTTAASVKEAKRILTTLRPHISVTDLAVPNDGLALIREVMRVAWATGIPNIPAIAISAHRGRREELLDEGFVELVEKPINPIAFCAIVRRHARDRFGHAEEATPYPICTVCRKPIPPGAGRIRNSVTAIHVECEKRGRPGPGFVSAEAE